MPEIDTIDNLLCHGADCSLKEGDQLQSNKAMSLIFQALSDQSRLKIIEVLSCQSLCGCQILKSMHISQPTLSYHLKLLVDCGMISSHRNGSMAIYTLNRELFDMIIAYLDEHLLANRKVIKHQAFCVARRDSCV